MSHKRPRISQPLQWKQPQLSYMQVLKQYVQHDAMCLLKLQEAHENRMQESDSEDESDEWMKNNHEPARTKIVCRLPIGSKLPENPTYADIYKLKYPDA